MRSFVSLVKNNSDDPVMEIALPTLLGITTGLLLGLTGAGGGIVAAPLLMLVLHQSVTAAAPISLLSITMGALVGTLMGLRSGQVRYRAALLLSAAGLLFQPLGIYASHVIPNTPLLLFFAAVLGYLGLRYWRGKTIARDKDPACAISPTNKRFIWNKPCLWVMTRTGLLAGFLSGLLGLGGWFCVDPRPTSSHHLTHASRFGHIAHGTHHRVRRGGIAMDGGGRNELAHSGPLLMGGHFGHGVGTHGHDPHS